MRTIIQKFGGTSVASPETREMVLKKIKNVRSQGIHPVIVVSAIGRAGDHYATDTLISLARSIYKDINAHELDLLMYCGELISAVVMTATLQAAGIDAFALTGGQAGIITDAKFNNANILKIDTTRLVNLLKAGKTPVVCGFQGITADGEFTTLGRGGSDTTAAALGSALGAELVEIYTDVDGIATADPKIVDNAKIIDCISYKEICQMANQGAKVIHPRAVEMAMQNNIPLVVKSTFSDAPGTMITNFESEKTEKNKPVIDRIVTGVAYLPDIAQIKVDTKNNTPTNENFRVFKILADIGISVDLINVSPEQIMFTVNEDVSEKAAKTLIDMGYNVEILPGCAKVSIVGGGMREVPGVIASFVEALSSNAVPILQTVDSHTSISALIKKSNLKPAIIALHEKFGLAK